MKRLFFLVVLAVGCGDSDTATPTHQDIPAVVSYPDGDSDGGDSVQGNGGVVPANPCGEVSIRPMCNIKGGPGIFLYADNCTVYGATQMTGRENNMFCKGPDAWDPPPETIFDFCPVPGLCGDPPLPE
jgi:hypothetical protein